MPEELAKYLERERAQRGLSVNEFVAWLGIGKPAYTYLVKGTRASRIETLDTISARLGLPLARVLELYGYDLREGRSAGESLLALLRRAPEFGPLAAQLAELPDEDLRAILAKIDQDLRGLGR